MKLRNVCTCGYRTGLLWKMHQHRQLKLCDASPLERVVILKQRMEALEDLAYRMRVVVAATPGLVENLQKVAREFSALAALMRRRRITFTVPRGLFPVERA